jgi:murein L,D-transpeptidase YcbB/YkuD
MHKGSAAILSDASFPVSFVRPLFVGVSLALASAAGSAFAAEPPAELQKRLEGDAQTLKVGDRMIDPEPLRAFYRQRSHRLAWSGTVAESKGDRLIMDIQSIAVGEGLNPDNYAIPPTMSDVDRDVLLSDALARFGHDLATGRVAPTRQVGGMGPETRPRFDASRFLSDISSGKDLGLVIDALPPPYAGYQRLKAALETYRRLAATGDWTAIPDGPSIKTAEHEDERVPLVRRRLIQTGDLTPDRDKGKSLDKPLMEALKRFQVRHGIEPDGFVGKQTLAAMNVPAQDRMHQIQANLDRWRWMPRKLDPSHIAVNLPAAHLELVREGRIEMEMRVVVGDLQHQTPPMMTTLGSVVLNPTWTVPPNIATKEILPKLRKDSHYLVANNMTILDAFADDSQKSQGLGIDWSKHARFPWRLRQRPGPDNALGQVKFNLSNSDDIYLHDTPKRQYFGRIFRALSHGCIRLERPVDLAKALVGGEMADKVPDLIAAADTRTLKLDKPLTVYLMYFTAWADEDGTVHFRDDLYGHDGRLKAALRRPAR